MLHGKDCPENVLAIKDALEALEGKWKLLILFSLSYHPRRFRQLAQEVHGITDKMLSKELKQLEANRLIKREIKASFPPTVEYTITSHGQSLSPLFDELHHWGLRHRKEIIGA